MRCEDVPGLLPFHVEGTLPKESMEAADLASHLASCPACRGLEADAREIARGIRALPTPHCPGRRSPARDARRVWIPAAAGLLLALGTGTGLWAMLGRTGPQGQPVPPVASPVPSPAPARPGRQEAKKGGLVLRLPAGGTLSCLPGTRLVLPEKAGEPILLDRGAIWCRSEGALPVQTPLGLLQLAQGDAVLRCTAAPAAWSFWREAGAEEDAVLEIVLLAGARADWKRESWTGPCLVLVTGKGPHLVRTLDAQVIAGAFAFRDEAEGAGPWRELKAGQVGSAESRGEALLERLAGEGFLRDLAIEVELKAPAGSQVGLCYPQGQRTAYTTLGSGALSPGAWQVFRVRRQGGRLEIFADAKRLVSSTDTDAQDRMATGYPAAGILVWQGPVEVRRLRWRALGMEAAGNGGGTP